MKKVLFVCVHNSARSQLAESLMREMFGERYEFYSAGFSAGEVHRHTRTVLSEVGVDASKLRAKGFASLKGLKFDIVISVCDKDVEQCPPFANGDLELNLPFVDPASRVEGLTDEEGLVIFRQARDEIRQRLRHFFLIMESRAPEASPEITKSEIEKQFQDTMFDSCVTYMREFNAVAPKLGDTFACVRRNDLTLYLKEETEKMHQSDTFAWFALSAGLWFSYSTSNFLETSLLTGDQIKLLFLVFAFGSSGWTVYSFFKNRRGQSVDDLISRIIRRVF